jgi:mannose-1-phosphate guanylyltransferase
MVMNRPRKWQRHNALAEGRKICHDSRETMTQAMILAAGLSTRLGSLSEERPKPLLPVCDRPLIQWGLELCRQAGIHQASINLHHRAEMIPNVLGDGKELGVELLYSRESEILGTGGGIKRMAHLRPRQTTVVVNGKIVVDLDLKKAIEFHRERRALATMVLYPHAHAKKWGAIGIGPHGQITSFLGETHEAARVEEELMFTGIHILEPEFIDRIPEGPCCIVRTAYQQLFQEKAALWAYVHRGYFYEHSTPERYLEGNFNLLRGECDPPAKPGPLRGIAESAEIDPSAEIIAPVLIGENVRIGAQARIGPLAIIGHDAEVSANVSISQSVVWPQAKVDQNANRLVITGQSQIEVPQTEDPTAAPRTVSETKA